jgi:hypothetical protein
LSAARGHVRVLAVTRRARAPTIAVPFLLASGLMLARAQDARPERATDAPPPAQEGSRPPRGAGGAPPSDDAFEMGSPPALPAGTTEEAMWPAATAEGWKKPVLVAWQRSFDDALRVARAEKKPILVAVNMDGEIASEHWAGVRYRDPDTAAQLARYACVIASVYRHTVRDHDETGKRVECPRFGTVTCGEHVEAERELYGKYFDGKRISPRHIVLDLEAKETLDVYYSWDTATVTTTFAKGVEGWPAPTPPPERSLTELAASADVKDRIAVERAYATGDRATRVALLETLRTRRVVDQVEVLRAGAFGLDLELAKLARHALAQCETEGALDLMAEVLKTPLEASERELLLAAVARIARTSPRARTLAALHGGLALSSKLVEPAALARAAPATASEADPLARRPTDAEGLLAFAEALLGLAEEGADRRHARMRHDDATDAVREAEKLGARGPRIDALAAVAAAGLGADEEARKRAVAAVEAGLFRAEGPALASAVRARVLRLFGDARQRAIRAAYRAGTAWPSEWLADAVAAYSALAAEPLADPAPLVEYHDFLRWIGASARATAVLEDALRRFPGSAPLHERLREDLLWRSGPAGLERGYAERLAREPVAPREAWFAGYAALVAAEHHRRRAEHAEAVAAYGRAVARFEADAERFPDGRDEDQHFVALALAGRARVALEQGDLATATHDLLAALLARPDSAASADGLGLTPVMTARMLQSELRARGDLERAERVQAALDGLDPALLEPPASELPGGARRPPARGAGRYRPPPPNEPR